MKKYLMSGVAAIAFLAAFTSCSKSTDLYDAGAVKEKETQEKTIQKNTSYEEAFTKRYGTIDSNNDWGFGNIGKAKTRAAVEGRANAFSSSFTFPTTPEASIYAESIPEGVTYLGDYKDPWGGYQLYHFNLPNNTAWLDAAAVANCGMNFNRYSYTIYVKGEVVAPDDTYFAAGCKLYLTKGAKLTLPGTDYSFGQNNMQVYVADGAELICNGQLQFSTSKLYNNGKVTANTIDVAGTGMIYNSAKGTIKTTGVIKFSNAGSVVVNDGKIEAEYLGTEGGSKFMNNGITDLSGDTEISSNDNIWVNNGKYITENFTYTAGSADVINNCMLTVRNKFYIGLGSTTTNGFKVDGGVLTKDFEAHGPANIFMASSTVFKVTNQAKMEITVVGNGIYGPESGDYAVFQAKDIVWGGENNYCVSYFNNLCVIADTHFAHAYLDGTSDAAKANGGVGNNPTYFFDDNVKMCVNGTNPDFSIEETECNPGIGGNKDEIQYAVRIICEDLGASDDFDFNDVVFDALIEGGKTYIKVLAAGGTLPLTVAGKEVHKIFEVGTKTMVNTQPNAHNATKTDKQEFVIDQAYPSYKDIPVMVGVDADANPMTNEGMTTLKAEKGAAPQKIAVDTNFEWCDERQQIEDKYTNFGEYVQKSGTRWQ